MSGFGPPRVGVESTRARRRWVILGSVLAVVLTAAAIAVVAVALRPAAPGPSRADDDGGFHAFRSVTVTADFDAVGAGVNVDTIAFWDAPDPTQSLMFVTSKNRSLVEVWMYPYASARDEGTPLRHDCLQATSSSATNGVVVDQEADLLYVASNNSPNVCVFSLPGLDFLQAITSDVTFDNEPNLALLTPTGGPTRLYVSNDSTVYIHDATGGQKLGQFTPTSGLETMWGDDHDQVLYIPDENGRTGVYAYQPDGTVYTRNGVSRLGDSTIFDSDAEGILEYTCPATGTTDDGTGLIVVSDQIDNPRTGNDYEVFDRRTWAHLGTFKLRLPSGEFVHNTDGIGTTQQASAAHPDGVFTAVQDDRSVAGVGWDKIFAAISAQTGRSFGCGDTTATPTSPATVTSPGTSASSPSGPTSSGTGTSSPRR